MKPLRDYQQNMVARARSAIAAGHRRIIVQAPTGSGKTRVAVEIILLAQRKGNKVLFLAPRRELIYQTEKSLREHGIDPGFIMAGEKGRVLESVQVASYDTLHHRGMRNKSIPMPDADVVLVDECHLSLSETRKAIIESYTSACVIGLTATPARGDGKGLGAVYQHLVVGPSVPELTAGGFLVPARYFAPTKPDLAAVGLGKDGDYREVQLERVMNDTVLIGDIVENWKRLASNRRTVVFCVSCAHSRHVRDAFLEAGISAEHVDGKTPTGEREDILERVKRGATQVLCNVFVASYGLDIPALDCAVLARPTKNIALYIQTVGRVLRPFPGKEDALIIDHAGAVLENGFVDDFIPWSLDEKSKVKDRKKASQEQQNSPKEIECSHCHTVFRGRKDCPSCGAGMIPETKEIPVHKADLQEVERDKSKAMTLEQKMVLWGELVTFAKNHAYRSAWIEHKFKERTGSQRIDNRVREAPAVGVSKETANWIKSQQIRWAKVKDKYPRYIA